MMMMVQDIWTGQSVTLQQEEELAVFCGSPGSFLLFPEVSARTLSPEFKAGTFQLGITPWSGARPNQTTFHVT